MRLLITTYFHLRLLDVVIIQGWNTTVRNPANPQWWLAVN